MILGLKLWFPSCPRTPLERGVRPEGLPRRVCSATMHKFTLMTRPKAIGCPLEEEQARRAPSEGVFGHHA
jgi:hypothetical protein